MKLFMYNDPSVLIGEASDMHKRSRIIVLVKFEGHVCTFLGTCGDVCSVANKLHSISFESMTRIQHNIRTLVNSIGIENALQGHLGKVEKLHFDQDLLLLEIIDGFQRDALYIMYPPSNPLLCSSCGNKNEQARAYKRCSGCKCAHYCNVTCQKFDWDNGHKAVCKTQLSSV